MMEEIITNKFEFDFKIENMLTWDTTWFKDCWITELPFTHVPRGTYTPDHFGFILPWCKEINVEKCNLPTKNQPDFKGELAHAHPDDEMMCIKSGKYVLTDRCEPSDIVLHEYAHILCGEVAGHGAFWLREAKRLGVKNPSPKAAVEYIGEPRFNWSPSAFLLIGA